MMFRATVCLKGELKESISGYHSKHDGYSILRMKSRILLKKAGQSSKDGDGLSSANRELIENVR